MPRPLKHLNLDPPFGGGTHSPLPLVHRGLLVLADEATSVNCRDGRRYIWMLDVQSPENPVSIAAFPEPEEADYCAKGGNFGPHNLHENRRGAFWSDRIVFATYQNAGVRVYDTNDPFRPREIAYYVPPDPASMVDPRPGRAWVNPVCRLLRRPKRRDLRDRSQCRPAHPPVPRLMPVRPVGRRLPRRIRPPSWAKDYLFESIIRADGSGYELAIRSLRRRANTVPVAGCAAGRWC